MCVIISYRFPQRAKQNYKKLKKQINKKTDFFVMLFGIWGFKIKI
jgi:hypothetical protein